MNVCDYFKCGVRPDVARRTRIALGRYGRESEVADTAAFLISDSAGYITGQNLRVDGRLTRAV